MTKVKNRSGVSLRCGGRANRQVIALVAFGLAYAVGLTLAYRTIAIVLSERGDGVYRRIFDPTGVGFLAAESALLGIYYWAERRRISVSTGGIR